MPLFVNMSVVIAAFLTTASGRNNDFGFILFKDEPDKLVGIVGFIGNQAVKLKVEDQRFGLRDVVVLARRQQKAQRIPQPIDADVNFGTEATTTIADGLFRLTAFFFKAPAAQGWARTMVLSRMRCSRSGSSAKC